MIEKVGVYCRLSDEDRFKANKNDDSDSIINQRSMCLKYANQNNPNNKAYKANIANQKGTKSNSKTSKKYDIGILDGESYGWCDD